MLWTDSRWRNMVTLFIVVLGASFFCTEAFSQDLHRGEQLAKTWCISCHSVDAGGPELRNETVPSFTSIARESATSQSSLELFLYSPHPRMPAYGLKRKEVRDVAAYIMSLRSAHGE